MTDPTPTRDEVDIEDRLRAAYSLVAVFPENQTDGFTNLLVLRNMVPEAADMIQALRERAEAADSLITELRHRYADGQVALTEARRAEAAAWNDAIEAAAGEASTWLSADDSPILREHIRALRRDDPTEGEA